MTELYTPEWFARRSKWIPFAERALLALFALEGIPKSMLDVGCGTGYLVALAHGCGADAIGVDVAAPNDPVRGLCQRDLREPLDLGRTFDLTISWEVAEHLPPESADTFVGSIARHVGKLLVFTAAQPGQGGDGHLNEQPPHYWREKLKARGLVYDDKATQRLRDAWRDACGPAWWYARNALVLRKQSASRKGRRTNG